MFNKVLVFKGNHEVRPWIVSSRFGFYDSMCSFPDWRTAIRFAIQVAGMQRKMLA